MSCTSHKYLMYQGFLCVPGAGRAKEVARLIVANVLVFEAIHISCRSDLLKKITLPFLFPIALLLYFLFKFPNASRQLSLN